MKAFKTIQHMGNTLTLKTDWFADGVYFVIEITDCNGELGPGILLDAQSGMDFHYGRLNDQELDEIMRKHYDRSFEQPDEIHDFDPACYFDTF